ncbi:MAG: SDR family oxidoreductase [Verrucomicrobia bacterium]|nr:SDR family oxidoreductase [Verrucomicrobiota bacterium]
MELKEKVCLITGGTKGIGAATAIEVAKRGANVAILGRHDDEEAVKTRKSIEKLGRRCELILADCAKAEAMNACVGQTVERLGPVDVLVHAAGGPVNGGLFQITEKDWHSAFDVHVHPIFFLCRAVIPAMQKKKEGAIILVSSTAGIRGIITNIAYQVAKGAIPQFARALAREFANDNIRINCVAPGVVRTAFHATMTEQQRKLNLEQRIPLHREGTPEQVATLITELITNDYITGETFTIDGGLTMRIA